MVPMKANWLQLAGLVECYSYGFALWFKLSFSFNMILWIQSARQQGIFRAALPGLTQRQRQISILAQEIQENFQLVQKNIQISIVQGINQLLQIFFLFVFFNKTTEEMAKCYACSFGFSSLEMMTPILIRLVLDFVSDRQHNTLYGVALVVAVVVSRLLICLFDCHSSFHFNLLGYNLANAVSLSIFHKASKYSFLTSESYQASNLVNMLQVDTQKIQQLTLQTSQITFLPLQLLFGLYLMYDTIGIAFLFGMIVLVIMGLINYIIGYLQVKFQKQLMARKDERMKITSETFSSIKYVKVNAFEEHFYDKIDGDRSKELSILTKKFFCGVASICSLWTTPMLILCATFTAYIMIEDAITPQKAFTVISIFYILQEPIRSIPIVASQFIETYVSLNRIQAFLLQPEMDRSYITQDCSLASKNKQYAIRVKNGYFYWKKHSNVATASEVDTSKAIQPSASLKTPIQSQKKDKTPRKNKNSIINQKEFFSDDGRNESINNSNDSNIKGNRKTNQLNTIWQHTDLQKLKKQSQYYETQSENSDEESAIQSFSRKIELVQAEQFDLRGIELNIPKGKIVAIIGDVGSGKSSLLYSLLGEMKTSETYKAKIELNGEIGFVSQSPWIMQGTIQSNILFGRNYQETKYQDCIRYANLLPDLQQLPQGDMCQIGERGANLSGGQRARIALARALYGDTDILLLDDILSAVDVHVAGSILQDCLLNYKKETTRILATHALQYLKYMDYIYVMDKGEITDQGTYSQIQSSERFQNIYQKYTQGHLGGTSEDSLSEHLTSPEGEEEAEEEPINTNVLLESLKNRKQSQESQGSQQLILSQQISESGLSRQPYIARPREDSCDIVSQKSQEEEPPSRIHCAICKAKRIHKRLQKTIAERLKLEKSENLMVAEDRKRGEVSISVLRKYCKFNGGYLYIIGVLSSVIFWELIKMASNVVISEWTGHSAQSNNGLFLLGYGILAGCYGLMAIIRSGILLGGSMNCSRKIHRRMISSLIFAPLNEFFERVPLGRILNVLSKDISVVDSDLAYAISVLASSFSTIAGDTILSIYASSLWVIFPLALFAVCCYKLQKYYMSAQRELVRLETISRSPIIQFFAESLSGLTMIRSYRQSKTFIDIHAKNIDENKKNQFAFIAMEAWFKLNLTFLSLIVNTTAICFCLFYNQSDAAMTGLLLTFAFSIDYEVQDLVMSLSSVEKKIVSFERCYSYTKINPEKGQIEYLKHRKDFRNARFQLKDSNFDHLLLWPKKGTIQFENVHIKYRSNLQCVVKGITANIHNNEKIGVVGRTGAGKSTITLSILRVLEAFKGKILIDGIDIATVRLDQLREKITIILQEPYLFHGTLKQNLDPLGLYSDSDIIATLSQCQLGHLMDSEEGLEMIIDSSGSNLSIGETQLISIARALLKRSKIVLIDEATASMDMQTDFLIQQTISRVFKDCTVITIAHRINTIMKSDRIMVLNAGRVEEFDTPHNLLQNSGSLFFSLHNEFNRQAQL